MTCADLRDLLSAYADGQASPAQRELLDLHLERCRACQARLHGLRQTRELLLRLPADGWAPPPPRLSRTGAMARGMPGWCAALLVGALLGGGLTWAGQQEGRSLTGVALRRASVSSVTSTAGRPRRSTLPRPREPVSAPMLAPLSLPAADRQALVVVVYRVDNGRPSVHRRVAVGQVDDVAQTWSALRSILAESGPSTEAARPAPARQARGQQAAARWTSLRAI